MKPRFILFKRSGVYYSEDTTTRKQTSLRTKDAGEAQRFLSAKNEAAHHAEMNLQIAQVYLQHSDPALAGRTWQQVMETITSLKTGSTQERWQYAMQDEAFDLIRDRKLLETTAEHFLNVLKSGTVSTNVFLRRAHNFAIGMHWLPWPILPKLQWPKVRYEDKRAITLAEHQAVIGRERNPELRAFYQLLWHVGGSQTDVATLTAEDIDWKERTVSFNRCKSEVPVVIAFGSEAAALLATLPKSGPLFPWLSASSGRVHHDQMQAERLVEQRFMRVLLGGGYTLVARTDLDSAMKEKGLDEANLTDEKLTQEAGKFLHVSAIMVVSVDDFKTTPMQRNVVNNRPPGPFGNIGQQTATYYQVVASISARLVKIADNMVMWTGDLSLNQAYGSQDQEGLILGAMSEAIATSFPPLKPPAAKKN